MLKRLELDAQKISVSGTPNNKAWRRRILAAGGKTTSKVVQSTTLLIHGSGWSMQEEVAQGQGIPVLNEAQAELLLSQGFVEIELPDEGESSLDELIGELRSALDGPPSSEAWNMIVEQIDRCAPEHLDHLVNYLAPVVHGWRIDPDVRWEPSRSPAPPREWVKALPYGELRVTPHHWIAAMSRGESSPAHTLLRHLHLDEMKLSATKVAKILSLEHLTHLDCLMLGARNTYAPSLWKKIATLPSCEALTHFGMGEFRTKHAGVISNLEPWHPFDTLTIDYYFSKYDDDALLAFLKSDSCIQVQTLRMLESSYRVTRVLNKHPGELLPKLERVTIKDNGFIANILRDFHDLHYPVTSVVAECDVYMYTREELVKSFALPYHDIQELDLSEVRLSEAFTNAYRREGDKDALDMEQQLAKQFHDDLLDLLPGSVLAKSLDRIKLGRWWSEELANALEAHGTKAVR